MAIADQFAHLSPVKRALLALDEMKMRLDAAEQAAVSPIAIVGLGCRIPGADNPEALWTLLREGRTAVQEVPADRWNVDDYYDPDPSAPGKTTTKVAAFLDRIDGFDAGFFAISPREAMSMDPQQRLFLEVCWEALECAGIDPESLSGSLTGVFAGVAAGDYADLMRAQGQRYLDGHFASGVAHSILSGRVSYLLGLQGPSLSVDTACSSSLLAVHLACQSLRSGDCRMALAGGVNLMVTPDSGVLFAKTQMLSAEGRCKTFDAAADGFVRGEGCGIVVLKKLADAVADGDRIVAVILSSAVNQDGPSSGLTAPNGPAQEAVMRTALARAGLRPADVDVVEAHGTGTPLGDPIEVTALGAVHRGRPVDQPLAIGSLKTNVGHLEGAAGIAGLLKLVLALQHEAIPPHLHLKTPNPHIAWDELPLRIVTTLTPWSRGTRRRIGGVSSFGFSGTNVHVIVEEAPPSPSSSVEMRPAEIIALSARTPSALRSIARSLMPVATSGDTSLSALAHTLNSGRAQMVCRAALVVRSHEELAAQLTALDAGAPSVGLHAGVVAPGEPPRIAMLFTGQGAQYTGMAHELFAVLPSFQRTLEQCDAMLRTEMDRPLLSILFPATGESSPIDDTAYTQPALFAVEYALAQLWLSLGVRPQALLGHSLGEFVAACVAGVFSLEDGLRLVAARGRLMQAQTQSGAMVSVAADEARVLRAIAPHTDLVSIAAVNGPEQTVISGERLAVETIAAALQAEGVNAKALTVSHAFHSPLMAPMLAEFDAIARTVTYRAPRLTLISNVSGRAAAPADIATADYWVRHVLAPVRFADCVRTLRTMGVNTFLEAGPHPTLLGMAGRSLEGDDLRWLPSLRKAQSDWGQLLESAARLYTAGVRIRWEALAPAPPPLPVSLPTYPFERERHWIETTASRPPVIPSSKAHPLLSHRVQVAGLKTVVLEGLIDRGTPWVFQHRVDGTVILPAAALIEIGLTAAAELWGDGEGAVAQLLMHQPLAIRDEGTTVQAVITEQVEGRATLRIFSAAEPMGSAASQWVLHAESQLERNVEKRSRAVTPRSAAMSRCHVPLEAAALYGSMAKRGLDLGPAFHGLSELRRGETESYAALSLPLDAGSAAGYRIHPILIDLAIQTLGATQLGVDGELSAPTAYLPLSVARAFAVSDAGPAAWAHVRLTSDAKRSDSLVADIELRDADGRVVAALERLRLQRVDCRDSLRRVGDDPRDWLYEIEWQDAVQVPSVPALSGVAKDVRKLVPEIAAAQGLSVFDEALPKLEALSAAYVAEAIREIGFSLIEGERLSADAVARTPVVPSHRRLLPRLLEILEETGTLQRDGEGWRVVRTAARPDVAAALRTLRQEHGGPLQSELALLARCGPELGSVLLGRTDPLTLLFPGGSAELAENLYQVSPAARAFNQLLAEALSRALQAPPSGRPLRVLEIGGGTGSTTSFVLPRLQGMAVDYLFTDVSPAFTAKAAHTFAAQSFVRCQPLDIERDPAAQGIDDRFDVVIAANVLHATRDLAATFAHVRDLMAPEALLVMLEMVRPQRWIDVTFGLTDGWWRFTDRERRPHYPLLANREWLQFLAGAGFEDAVVVPGVDDAGVLGIESAFLARRSRRAEEASGDWLVVGAAGALSDAITAGLTAAGQRCHTALIPENSIVETWRRCAAPRGVVFIDAFEQNESADVARAEEHRCGSLLELIKQLTDGAAAPLTMITRQAQPAGGRIDPVGASLWGMARTIALEHAELRCRTIDTDDSRASMQALIAELLEPGGESELALRLGSRFVPRLMRRDAAAATLAPRPDVYRLDIRGGGALDHLRFEPTVRRPPASDEVEVRVSHTALNFRDVLNALGMYPGDPGPFGNECAGTVTAVGDGVEHLAVGDHVVGLLAGSFASHVTGSAAFLARRPAALTAEQAVTVPIAYVTAFFALHHLGRLRAGERVLIHSAAGGVGLAAVHLARLAGAEVFATAGSDAKRDYLRSLGVVHVMSSRTPDFAAEIARHTKGQGVHLALNSLAGDLIAPTFATLADGGRFLEIGKSGWTLEQVRDTGRRVEYHVIDWSAEAAQAPALIQGMFRDVLARVGAGELPPLPSRTFDVDATESAFRYMAQAKHIGKVLVAHPSALPPTIVRGDGTYLVTGGLSGLGLLTAQWLAERGAGGVVLMGRNAPNADGVAAIARMRETGTRVTIHRGDVANATEVAAAIAAAGNPLRGVVHAAGVLDDGALTQLTWSKFATVMAPKVVGADHLDRLTRQHPLDFFLLYSSIASIFGSRGQANHAAANSFMDALAHRRRAEGLPALSINWGVWRDIGAAARLGVDSRSAEKGIGVVDPARGLAAMERLLRESAVQTMVCPIDWVRFTAGLNAARPSLLHDLLAQPSRYAGVPSTTTIATAVAPGGELMRQLAGLPEPSQARLIQAYVHDQAARILALPAGRRIDPRQPLNELGLDSLMAVELRNVLSTALAQPLPATLLFDYPTLQTLAAHLGSETSASGESAVEARAARTGGVQVAATVISRIEDLSDEEVERRIAERARKPGPVAGTSR